MSNRIIGSIPYSLSLKSSNPTDETALKKIYPTAQVRETIDLALLARHMAEHNTPFSEGAILGVLKDMVSCMSELLTAGYSVQLDGLARFYVSLKAKGAQTIQDFTTEGNIKKVKIMADISEEAEQALQNAEFEYVMTRDEQAAAKKAAKATLPQEEEESDNSGDTGDSGTGDNPDVNE